LFTLWAVDIGGRDRVEGAISIAFAMTIFLAAIGVLIHTGSPSRAVGAHRRPVALEGSPSGDRSCKGSLNLARAR
jgi:hypothetical protein